MTALCLVVHSTGAQLSEFRMELKIGPGWQPPSRALPQGRHRRVRARRPSHASARPGRATPSKPGSRTAGNNHNLRTSAFGNRLLAAATDSRPKVERRVTLDRVAIEGAPILKLFPPKIRNPGRWSGGVQLGPSVLWIIAVTSSTRSDGSASRVMAFPITGTRTPLKKQ